MPTGLWIRRPTRRQAPSPWRLATARGRPVAVKTRGALSTNDGGVAVNWALEGHGILLRAEWDIQPYLRSGRLVAVLPQYASPDADIYAVYPPGQQLAARVRAFVDFLAAAFARQGAPTRAA